MAAIKSKLYQWIRDSLVFLFRKIPERLRLDIRSNSEIIKKMDYEPYDIYLDIGSGIDYYKRLYSCRREPGTVEWIQSFIRENDVFWDIGANVGAYSLVASKFHRGKVKVYAFEPAYMNFAQLCKNVLINNSQESIFPLQISLSDKTTIDVFNYRSLTSGSSLHTLGESVGQNGEYFEPSYKQPVITYRIDDFISYFQLPAPNHIKIDVDGTEFKILNGAEQTLQNPILNSMLVELEEGEADKIVDFLAHKGLELHSRHKCRMEHVYNYIFQRKQ